jgi:ABC-type sulfate transport system permease component
MLWKALTAVVMAVCFAAWVSNGAMTWSRGEYGSFVAGTVLVPVGIYKGLEDWMPGEE